MQLDELFNTMHVEDREAALALTDYFEGSEGAAGALEKLSETSENPVVFHALRLIEQEKGGEMDYGKVMGYVEKHDALKDKAGTAYEDIRPVIEEYAGKGNLIAQLFLADMLQFGLGVAQDTGKAEEMFSALAQSGNLYARFMSVQGHFGGQQYARVSRAQSDEAAKERNASYSGKYLGDVFTEAQSAAIRAGTFDGLALGDYWTINGVNWRIADFDYLLRSDAAKVTEHHVMIVPDKNLYQHPMNDTGTTSGGYAGSKMRASGLDRAKAQIKAAFGEGHILPGYGVELMTKDMLFGDGSNQLSLFHLNPDFIATGAWYWLQDVYNSSAFCTVNGYGDADYNYASYANGGVRPAFALY